MTTAAPALSPQRPTSLDELAAAVRAAAAAGTRIQITGSNSLPLTHLADDRPVQPVSTLRLRALVEHAVSDMTVIVHAGSTLEALQQQLAWHNQWLPVDPPALDGRAPGARTLGGLIATNSLGPLRQGLGDWRTLILGTRWVNAAGELIKGGGRTVKNVAGYHTPRLLIGSCGTLGIIGELTLRTYARPTDEQALVIFARDAAEAEAIVAATLVSDTQPVYVQVIGGRAFAGNPLQLPASSQIVVVGFMDSAAVCAAQLATLRSLPAVAAVESIRQTAAQAGRLRLWMTTEPPGVVSFRAHLISSNVTRVLAALEACAAERGVDPWLVAEAGAGVIRGSLRSVHETPRPAELVAAVHTLVAAADGTLVVTGGGTTPSADPSALQTRLKQALDPQGVFGTL